MNDFALLLEEHLSDYNHFSGNLHQINSLSQVCPNDVSSCVPPSCSWQRSCDRKTHNCMAFHQYVQTCGL